MFYNILLIIQIIVAAAMIVLILMQQGKGADAGAAFGSGASGTVFGSRGSGNFLSRTTGILATIFFLNSIGLAWLVSNQTVTAPTSVMDQVQVGAPAAPASDVPAVKAAPASDVPAVPAVPGQETAPAAATQAPAAEVPAAPAAAVEPKKE